MFPIKSIHPKQITTTDYSIVHMAETTRVGCSC